MAVAERRAIVVLDWCCLLVWPLGPPLLVRSRHHSYYHTPYCSPPREHRSERRDVLRCAYLRRVANFHED